MLHVAFNMISYVNRLQPCFINIDNNSPKSISYQNKVWKYILQIICDRHKSNFDKKLSVRSKLCLRYIGKYFFKTFLL